MKTKSLLPIGTKLYLIKPLDEILYGEYAKCGFNKSEKKKVLKKPMEKKITQVVETKSGVLYQVKGAHIHEAFITKEFGIFLSYEEALGAICQVYPTIPRVGEISGQDVSVYLLNTVGTKPTIHPTSHEIRTYMEKFAEVYCEERKERNGSKNKN